MSSASIEIPFEIRPRGAEFAGVDLGDKRRENRAGVIFDSWGNRPEASLPQAMKDSAGLEGAYRFFNNPRVDSEALLAPHVQCSWDGAVSASNAGLWVLAIQDTTEMRFGGTKERAGLGALMNDGDGFYAHTGLLACLAETPDGSSIGVPLGVGGCEILVRPKGRPRAPEGMSRKVWARLRHFAEDNEFLRWERLASDLDAAAKAHEVSIVHVADREADEFSWMANIIERGGRFVIRQTKERRLERDSDAGDCADLNLDAFLSEPHPIRATRAVSFETASTQGGRRRRKRARKGRTTTLGVHAVSTTIRQPSPSRATQKTLDVNIVIVRELEPPEGERPIEWRLLTTESIDTQADVLRIVDAYCARWLIEEYFKAIKTGCSYEKLQLETLHGLKIALSFCLAIAWHMLFLRTLARDAPNVPADVLMTKTQLAVLLLVANTPANPWSVKLRETPNASDIMYAVARMGGHLKNNGPPGWQTLGRGFRELELLIQAQKLFAPRSDQS